MAEIIGWIFLISGWIIPLFIKNKEDKIKIQFILLSVSFGIFLTLILKGLKN